LNRLIRCVCGKKIGPDPRNFNQRVSLGRNDLLIRTFLNARVTFLKTKSGKKRTVPISAELEKMIKEEASGKFFNVDYVSFCKILKMVKPDIPPNQATYILRHTFASHFVMNGGNIIALQRILGHANIQQIMTYVHLSQEYLQNAVALNPLAGGISL
ncbi:tyrosine-type recombinase/integrase, partial [Enterobacter roggenkampii]|uniref:tyrosine-type recombinase/integrase n=1 Tax=Enterobacter roggenkampii TaxID=1812935 RepID=UPI001C70A280